MAYALSPWVVISFFFLARVGAVGLNRATPARAPTDDGSPRTLHAISTSNQVGPMLRRERSSPPAQNVNSKTEKGTIAQSLTMQAPFQQDAPTINLEQTKRDAWIEHPRRFLAEAGSVHLATTGFFQQGLTRRVSDGAAGVANASNATCTIAVLLAVCTRNTRITQASETDFLRYLNPSMVKTVLPEDPCEYAYYVNYDKNDGFYGSPEQQANTERALSAQWANAGRSMPSLKWIEVLPYEDGGTGPVRAWNEGFAQAYADGVKYFFWLGEDVVLLTTGWGPALSGALADQGNVGTVGPREMHYQKDTGFLSNTMVHRSHMDIFNSLFPVKMHNWWSDVWMHDIYSPKGLAKQISSVTTENMNANARYAVAWSDKQGLDALVQDSRSAIDGYLLSHKTF